jgi:hypothetical protein
MPLVLLFKFNFGCPWISKRIWISCRFINLLYLGVNLTNTTSEDYYFEFASSFSFLSNALPVIHYVDFSYNIS